MDIEQIQQLARMDQTLQDMHHRLFGNGQPGLIATLDQRIDALETAKAEIHGSIKTIKWLASLGPLVVGGLLSFVEYFLHPKHLK